ncbi:dihydroxyacetone phosphate acyltransferase isoform X1 [Schistocerca gregaria]|uniref:dihydroxyacetone phosphate acyltransferase isoform X1 n=1 Tax=Schistocerca gregaria TaxID=7010 RepID=UPI00211E078B|nr:dihydroxyacetone phosphate acyltransferase isoform X1 [Schistocerca gregaria]
MDTTYRTLTAFKDILEERRKGSDFMFMSKKFNPLVAYQHKCKTSPQKIKDDVLRTAQVQRVIDEVANEQNTTKEELYKTVNNILNEIGYEKSMPVIRWLGVLLLRILKQSYSALLVNESSIEKVKSVMGNNPVIFAPSHRSYADFILMSYLCFHYDIDIPVIAAGMDFHSMWLMGRLLRESCAFFMRRSFGKDKLYWTVFSEYVQKLVTDGDAAIEFFIEGTRSRTAKSLPPKFGFLTMALAPYFDGRVPDISIVPVNISYDRTLEESLFAYELLGIPKPKESTSGFVKALKLVNEHYGNIYVEFGEPISVKSFCQENGHSDPRLWRQAVPREVPAAVDLEAATVQELAYKVVHAQMASTVLTPFNVLAIALSGSLMWKADAAPSLTHIAREVTWLCSVLETLGALVDCKGPASTEEVLRESLSVHKSLITLTPYDDLVLTDIRISPREINTANLKAHSLSYKTMGIAVPLIMLQHYVNPVMHYIIGPAVVTVAMQAMPEAEIHKDKLFRKYHFIRLLLSHDFVFNGAWEVKEFEEALKQLDLLNIIETSALGNLALGNHRKLREIFCNLLQPFLEGYFVFFHVVRKHAAVPCTEKVLLQQAQKELEELLLRGEISHPYSLSLDMLASALKSLVLLQAVTKLKSSEEIKYQKNESTLSSIIHELGQLVSPNPVKNRMSVFSTELLRAKL